MRYPWEMIDGYKFETLAFDYARNRYPEQSWRLLPQSGDGNRDIESASPHAFPGQSVEILAWIEAKYTRSMSRSLSKGRLDPTLVSALIAPNVGFVLFISNGRFNDAYINRAERVFRLRQMLTRPQFVDGELLEHWLDRAPRIAGKYFARQAASVDKITRESDLAIRSSQIVALDDYRAAHIESRRNLRVEEDYVLQVLVSSGVGRKITARLSGEGVQQTVSVEFPDAIELRAGLTSVPLRFHVSRDAGRGRVTAMVRDGRRDFETVRIIDYSIAPAAVQIRSASQLAGFQRLYEHIRRHQRVPTSQVVLLVGAAAVGKTWVLSRISAHVSLGVAVMRFTFEANSPAHNAQCVCRGLLFMTIGAVFDFEGAADVIGRQIRTDDISEDVLQLLLQGHRSRQKASEVLHVLVKNDLLGPLFTRCARGDPKILVFDDVHKADEDTVQLLRRLLADFAGARNRTLVLLACRSELDPRLAESVTESLTETIEIGPVTADDIEETLHAVVGERASMISDDAGLVVSNVLELQSFAENLRAEGAGLQEMEAGEFLGRCRELMRATTVTSLVGRLHTAAEQLATDLIFLAEGGVECAFVQKRFGRPIVDHLLASGLVVATAAEKQLLRPKHDLLREAYLARHNIYSERLGDLVDAYMQWVPDRRSDLLGHLCRCGVRWQARYLNEAIMARDAEIRQTRYGAARSIAEALYHIAGNPRSTSSLSDLQRIEAIFAHADCTVHTRSTRQAVAIFREVIASAEKCRPSPDISALRLHATVEIFSQRFWLLDTRLLSSEIESFLAEIDRLPPTIAAHARVREACFTALNRKMMVLFLLDQIKAAEATYGHAVKLANAVGNRANLGHLLMDHGKSLYLHAPHEALTCLEQAQAVYSLLDDQERRRKVCASQTAFLRIIVSGAHSSDLDGGAESLLQAGYAPEYANALLEIVGVSLVEGRIERAEELLTQIGKVASALESPRRLFLYAHLRAVLAAMEGDARSAAQWHGEHAKAVSHLGPSYRMVAQHNLKSGLRKAAAWAHSKCDECLWVENRLW